MFFFQAVGGEFLPRAAAAGQQHGAAEPGHRGPVCDAAARHGRREPGPAPGRHLHRPGHCLQDGLLQNILLEVSVNVFMLLCFVILRGCFVWVGGGGVPPPTSFTGSSYSNVTVTGIFC